MDKWLEIPKDRKRMPVGRLCLIMALTCLLLLMLLDREVVVVALIVLTGFGVG